jgi:hypothetical protein
MYYYNEQHFEVCETFCERSNIKERMQILKCLDEETRKYRGEQTELSARP